MNAALSPMEATPAVPVAVASSMVGSAPAAWLASVTTDGSFRFDHFDPSTGQASSGAAPLLVPSTALCSLQGFVELGASLVTLDGTCHRVVTLDLQTGKATAQASLDPGLSPLGLEQASATSVELLGLRPGANGSLLSFDTLALP